jgi:hypothetical protein
LIAEHGFLRFLSCRSVLIEYHIPPCSVKRGESTRLVGRRRDGRLPRTMTVRAFVLYFRTA